MRPSTTGSSLSIALTRTLAHAQRIEDVHAACAALCLHYGFEGFIYGARFESATEEPMVWVIRGQVGEQEMQDNAGYLRLNPSQPGGMNADLAGALRSEVEQQLAQVLFQGVPSAAVRWGVSFPIRDATGGFGLLHLVSNVPVSAQNPAQSFPYADVLASQIHAAARRIWQGAPTRSAVEHTPSLRPREAECLGWVAEGKTAWEIARILTISERTVVFHLCNAMATLGVNNRQQAVARAMSLGLIMPR